METWQASIPRLWYVFLFRQWTMLKEILPHSSEATFSTSVFAAVALTCCPHSQKQSCVSDCAWVSMWNCIPLCFLILMLCSSRKGFWWFGGKYYMHLPEHCRLFPHYTVLKSKTISLKTTQITMKTWHLHSSYFLTSWLVCVMEFYFLFFRCNVFFKYNIQVSIG
jgi:hypothetical protein